MKILLIAVKPDSVFSVSSRHGLLTFAHAPISQIVLKKFVKISLIIKECPEEILIKLAIVLKILKSS